MVAKYSAMAAASLIVLNVQPASAQEQQAPKVYLEEIVVTARRTAERALDVPVAVTALSQEDVRTKSIQTATDLQNFVPSLNVLGWSTNQEFFTIRGMGVSGGLAEGGPGGGAGVVAYLAEAPATASGPGLFFDLDSLQVLKGPQGTLFGRNTTGGAVLLEPLRPSVDGVTGYGEVTLGDFERRELRGAVNLPIVADRLALRVAGFGVAREGYTTDVVTGRDYDDRNNYSLRAGLLALPSEAFENYLLVQYVAFDEHGPGTILSAIDSNRVEVAPAVPFFAAQQVRGIRDVSFGIPQVSEGRALTVIDNARWQAMPWLAIKNVFSYAHAQSNGSADGDGTAAQVADFLGADPGGWSSDVETFTEELQFRGSALGNQLDWQAGAYFEYRENPDPQTFNSLINTAAFGPVLTHQDTKDTKGRSRAYYAQGTLDLGALADPLNGLKFTLGYRYTWDYIYSAASISAPAFGGLCLTGPAPLVATFPDCLQSADSESSGPSWTAGLDYHVGEDTLVYLRSSRGYKSGGFNPAVPTADPFFTYSPEYVQDIELGLKSAFALGEMRGYLEFDVYHAEFEDLQRNVYALVSGFPLQVTANAASATVDGAELAARLSPNDSIEWALTYSYNDARYDTYITPPPLSFNLSGNRVPFSPEHKLSLSQRYRLPIDQAWGEIWFGATVSYQSEVETADDPQILSTIDEYTLISLRLDWTREDWDVSLFATNVTDEEYRVTSNPTYFASGLVGTVYGEPRMIGASVRRRF